MCAASSRVPIGPISVHQSAGMSRTPSTPGSRCSATRLAEERQRPHPPWGRRGVGDPRRHDLVRVFAVRCHADGANTATWNGSGWPAVVQRQPDVRRRRGLSEHDPTSDPAGQRQRLGPQTPASTGGGSAAAGRAATSSRCTSRPSKVTRLAGEQSGDDGDDLLERRQGRRGAGTHLPHPRLHAVADAGQDTSRREPHRVATSIAVIAGLRATAGRMPSPTSAAR